MTTQGETHGICHHPRKPGRLCRRHALAKTQSQSIGDRSPATAVVQGFIKDSLNTFIKGGFSVITYDYRGTGLSKSGRVRHNKNTMSDWIEQDVGCITAWAKARAPGLTLLAIGHSMAGMPCCYLPPPPTCEPPSWLPHTQA